MAELKQCAHCGGEAKRTRVVGSKGLGDFVIWCTNCHIRTITFSYDCSGSAQETWNTRKLPPEVQSVVDAACDVVEMQCASSIGQEDWNGAMTALEYAARWLRICRNDPI